MTSKKNRLIQALPLILQASLCCLLWATAIPTLKVSYKLLNIESSDIYNRLVLAGMRFLIAGILITLFILIKEKKVTLVTGKQWFTVIIFGLLNTTIQYLFFYNGVGNTGAIKGVLIDTSKPLMVVILAHFLTRDDRISSNKIIGLCHSCSIWP
jgi:drug/metabolite transporter (DMT)-like permease